VSKAQNAQNLFSAEAPAQSSLGSLPHACSLVGWGRHFSSFKISRIQVIQNSATRACVNFGENQ